MLWALEEMDQNHLDRPLEIEINAQNHAIFRTELITAMRIITSMDSRLQMVNFSQCLGWTVRMFPLSVDIWDAFSVPHWTDSPPQEQTYKARAPTAAGPKPSEAMLIDSH